MDIAWGHDGASGHTDGSLSPSLTSSHAERPDPPQTFQLASWEVSLARLSSPVKRSLYAIDKKGFDSVLCFRVCVKFH